MTGKRNRSKVAVQCIARSAIHTAWTRDCESFRLIGADECGCGKIEFQPLS